MSLDRETMYQFILHVYKIICIEQRYITLYSTLYSIYSYCNYLSTVHHTACKARWKSAMKYSQESSAFGFVFIKRWSKLTNDSDHFKCVSFSWSIAAPYGCRLTPKWFLNSSYAILCTLKWSQGGKLRNYMK